MDLSRYRRHLPTVDTIHNIGGLVTILTLQPLKLGLSKFLKLNLQFDLNIHSLYSKCWEEENLNLNPFIPILSLGESIFKYCLLLLKFDFLSQRKAYFLHN